MGIPASWQQTDTTSSIAASACCSTRGNNSASPTNKKLLSGGTAGTTEVLISLDGTSIIKNAIEYGTDSADPGAFTVPAGTWTLGVNISTAESHTTIEEVYICRADSSGNSIATIASIASLAISCSSTGVKTINITGGSQTTFASTDCVRVIVACKNTDAIAHNLGWKPSATLVPPTQIGDPPPGGHKKKGFPWKRIRKWYRKIKRRVDVLFPPIFPYQKPRSKLWAKKVKKTLAKNQWKKGLQGFFLPPLITGIISNPKNTRPWYKKQRRRQHIRKRPRREAYIPTAVPGGFVTKGNSCPKYSIQERLSATALIKDELSATALIVERTSCTASIVMCPNQ